MTLLGGWFLSPKGLTLIFGQSPSQNESLLAGLCPCLVVAGLQGAADSAPGFLPYDNLVRVGLETVANMRNIYGIHCCQALHVCNGEGD